MSIFGREYGAYKRGKDDAEHRARVQAFAALRAAARIAREWDEKADSTDLDIAHGGSGWASFQTISDEIRYAIRHAINASQKPRGDYEVKP